LETWHGSIVLPNEKFAHPSAPMPTTPISAALLLGGFSRRMGRDKALLELPGGEILWQRQLRLLESMETQQILISGRASQKDYLALPEGVTFVADEVEGLGPLGGISQLFSVIPSDHFLLVLAVDLPEMNSAVLHKLLDHCAPGCGAVFRNPQGWFEPLAAIYPPSMADSARENLRQDKRSLQPWVGEAATAGLLAVVEMDAGTEGCFRNWNEGSGVTTPEP
jgi:molybdopterin-guanine dinucleotide biosynthesis protein A